MFLFDTSIIIKMLREKKFEPGAISVITLIEILRGVPKNKRKTIKRLLEETFDIIGINNNTILKYCELYEALKRSGSLISDADLLIAACASTYNLKLKTMDKDFERLKELGLDIKIV